MRHLLSSSRSAVAGGVVLCAATVLIIASAGRDGDKGKQERSQLELVVSRLEARLQQASELEHDLSATLQLAALNGTATHAKPTRRVLANSKYYINGSTALQAWRSSLLMRMAKMYTAIEAEQYQTKKGWLRKKIARVEPSGHRRYELFNPIIACPKAQQLQRLGSDGDGGKLLCPLEELKNNTCLVLSIGSNGQTDFEAAILKDTLCDIHTFDCTWNGSSIDSGRHTYHRICLGDKTERRSNMEFKTLPDIVNMLGKRNIDLLKVDVEGFEHEVVAGFDFRNSCNFPRQISMEVHYKQLYMYTGLDNRDNWGAMFWPMHELSLAELAVFFGQMGELGYAIVSREDNPIGEGCCSEFTFMRVEQPAHCV